MRSGSVASTFARGWTAAYTAGLPRETRDRRRAEIASDLWDQQHEPEGSSDPAPLSSAASRAFLGMSADLMWRSRELQHARKLELMNLKVDREWDWKMRLISHTAIIVLIAFFSALAFDGPQLLVITLPLGAIAVGRSTPRLPRRRATGGRRPTRRPSTARCVRTPPGSRARLRSQARPGSQRRARAHARSGPI